MTASDGLLWLLLLAGCEPDYALGAPEVCDGADNDGDGLIDEGFDADRDGYVPCAGPGAPLDCDDASALVRPFAPEACDGRDTDCDGTIPDFEADHDSDGFRVCEGDCEDGTPGLQPEDADGDGWSACDGDCDDLDPARHPAAIEVCNGADDDCDGDLPAAESDADADGSSACDGDCNDADALVGPADNDGDGASACGALADCDDSDALVRDRTLWFADADGDGFGMGLVTAYTCEPPVGHVAGPGDCDDSDPTAYPGAPEVCDGQDDDCDQVPDQGLATAVWYADADGDGWGDSAQPFLTCASPVGYAPIDGDCDDTRPWVGPFAAEICNGLDDDCDARVDVGAVDASTWYTDSDGDGAGDPSTAWIACDPLSGQVATADDCDDADRTVHPAAVESCGDAIDQDCDGSDLPCA